MEFEFKGEVYETRREPTRGSCTGCAFMEDHQLCAQARRQLSECDEIIFVEKEAAPPETETPIQIFAKLASAPLKGVLDVDAYLQARRATDPTPADRKEMLLSADPIERKSMPITTGVLDYFPLAMAEIAKVSKAGNDQHNPGQRLHWDKTKSLDHADCIARHLIDRGSRDSDGMRHSAKLCWRALALLQTELEAEQST